MLTKRLLTAIIAIPLLIASIYLGSKFVFMFIVMLCVGFALYEFYKMNIPNHKFIKVIAILAGLAVVYFVHYYQDNLTFENTNVLSSYITWLMVIITIAVFIFLFLNIIYFPKKVFLLNNPLILLIGIVYVGLFLSYLILIRSTPDGRNWVLFTLLVVWFGDTGAYFTGSLIGKHKLFPATSPKKTVEGALGCLAASIIAAFATKIWLLKELDLTHCIFLALSIAIIGQLGDLCESTFKRINDIKDSSNLLPGHGGMLDRIDSVLFVAPLVYYYKVLLL